MHGLKAWFSNTTPPQFPQTDRHCKDHKAAQCNYLLGCRVSSGSRESGRDPNRQGTGLASDLFWTKTSLRGPRGGCCPEGTGARTQMVWFSLMSDALASATSMQVHEPRSSARALRRIRGQKGLAAKAGSSIPHVSGPSGRLAFRKMFHFTLYRLRTGFLH